MSKINFISDLLNLFCLVKDLFFKLNRQVGKGERNDKMTRKSKSKASYNLNESLLYILYNVVYLIFCLKGLKVSS